MQLLLNLMLILEHTIDPALEHIFTHGTIHTVLETLVLEIELDVIFALLVSYRDIKENFHGTFGDGSKFVWLGELYVIPI